MRDDGQTAIFVADMEAEGIDRTRLIMATLEIPHPGTLVETSAEEKRHYGVDRPGLEVVWLRDEWINESPA